MTEYPHVPAAHINALVEEGTREELCEWLQQQWNELVVLRRFHAAQLQELRADLMIPTHRHKKRGTEYVLIGFGKMQAENWCDLDEYGDPFGIDMREVAIYRSVDDGSLWVRPREEFEDGRFEVLAEENSNG